MVCKEERKRLAIAQASAERCFVVRQGEATNTPGRQNNKPSLPRNISLNTNAYNTVLVEISHIIFLVIALAVEYIMRKITKSAFHESSKSLERISIVWMYICDSTPLS